MLFIGNTLLALVDQLSGFQHFQTHLKLFQHIHLKWRTDFRSLQIGLPPEVAVGAIAKETNSGKEIVRIYCNGVRTTSALKEIIICVLHNFASKCDIKLSIDLMVIY